MNLPSGSTKSSVAYFTKPHSYTTDDIVEISAHGSPVVLRHIVELCRCGRRAGWRNLGSSRCGLFLNGRIDLTQAEAVREPDRFADALSGQGRQLSSLEGALLAALAAHQAESSSRLIATLEAGIDFCRRRRIGHAGRHDS